jgi:hypothetical protein
LRFFKTNRIPLSLLVLFLFQSCAPVPLKPPPSPYGHQAVARILSEFGEQEARVDTFFSSGRLTVQTRDSESGSDILIIGSKNPFKLKIELTHAWGRPLLHIMIHDSKVKILSFTEKKFYHGNLGTTCSLSFFPAHLDSRQLWALLRAFPHIRKYSSAVSLKGNQITLLNGKAETIQVFDLYPESTLPRLVWFPKQGIKISFSDFESSSGLKYARKIRLEDPGTETILALKLKETVFNKTLPESIFELKKPKDFEMLPLCQTLIPSP